MCKIRGGYGRGLELLSLHLNSLTVRTPKKKKVKTSLYKETKNIPLYEIKVLLVLILLL